MREAGLKGERRTDSDRIKVANGSGVPIAPWRGSPSPWNNRVNHALRHMAGSDEAVVSPLRGRHRANPLPVLQRVYASASAVNKRVRAHRGYVRRRALHSVCLVDATGGRSRRFELGEGRPPRKIRARLFPVHLVEPPIRSTSRTWLLNGPEKKTRSGPPARKTNASRFYAHAPRAE